MAILKDNEYIEFEGRDYLNPQVSLDEQTAFIENLRNTQQANNQQIKTDTYNLGTAVPSNLGGLTGGEGYWASRYQTPQTNSLINDLRAVAQANALNQVLSNEQAKMKKRYNDAYNSARRRAAAGASGYSSVTDGGVEYEDTEEGQKKVSKIEPSYSPMGSGDFTYTPNSDMLSGNNAFPTENNSLAPANTLTPSGTVNIQRDGFGNITSLTYNGQTFTGNAAQQRYEWLQANGTVGGRK